MDERAARHIADELSPDCRLHAHASIDWFKKGWLWFKPDGHGRVHTNVTNLKRELRPTLHFRNGETLVELDIRCSQPTLLYGMLPKGARAATDALEYLELCRSGDLYAALAGDMLRDDAKRAFFHFLYSYPVETHGRRRRIHSDPVKERARCRRDAVGRLMAARFPTVNQFIVGTKRQRGHRGFSHEMQRLESGLVIDSVCGRLMRENPDISILTIHDSLLTNASSASKVQTTFDRTLQAMGIAATVSATTYKRSDGTTGPTSRPTPI